MKKSCLFSTTLFALTVLASCGGDVVPAAVVDAVKGLEGDFKTELKVTAGRTFLNPWYSGSNFSNTVDKTIEELVDFVNDLKMRVSLNFSPEDMKTLAKSGRLNKIVAMLGGILNIKPVIFLNDEGKFQVRQKVIGRKKALNKMIEQFKENYNFESNYVYVLHSDKVEDAELILNEIKKDDKFKDVNFIVDFLGVIVGAHGGPGNICLCYTAKNR